MADSPLDRPFGRESFARVYRRLDSEKIVETIRALHRRILERFPEAGLARVADELRLVAEKAAENSAAIARPFLPFRLGVAVLVAVFVLVATWLALHLKVSGQIDRFSELLQALDAALNTVLLIGGAIFSLFALETRMKRNRALKRLHELRALAHVVDMHQLTKDPATITSVTAPTSSSPRRTMTRFELSRYLDYCSEMASLIGKVAALYVAEYDDPVVLAAVDQIEDFTASLSRKAWQKIMINQQLQGDVPEKI